MSKRGHNSSENDWIWLVFKFVQVLHKIYYIYGFYKDQAKHSAMLFISTFLIAMATKSAGVICLLLTRFGQDQTAGACGRTMEVSLFSLKSHGLGKLIIFEPNDRITEASLCRLQNKFVQTLPSPQVLPC